MGNPTTTQLQAAAGAAHGDGATERACAQALADLAGPAGLVIAFPSGVGPERAAAEAASAAGGVPVAGMTGSGSIGADGAIESGCSALALGAGTPVGIGLTRGAGRNLQSAARRAAREALRGLGSDIEAATILLFLDTRSGDQAEAVAGVYSVAGPAFPIAGGGAGGADPAPIAPDGAGRDTVVAVAIGGRVPAGIGMAHGCRSRGAPAIATRTDGRILYELDGRPASDVYLERLGYGEAELGREEFEALAVTHPLAQPELSGESRLRHVLGRGPERGLECATHIPVNAAVEFTHQSPADIVEASGRAVRFSLARLEAPPRAVLIFDCAGRKRAVAGALSLQVEALLGALGDARPPLAGVFSHGEVFRLRGAKGDRNHAVVVAAFE